MPLTPIILSIIEPALLVIGIALLNWIFRPPYHQQIDFILLLVLMGIFVLFAMWALLLSYGLDSL